jgi:hypothetical protein
MNLKKKNEISSIVVFASNNEIDIELSSNVKEFIEKVHNAYVMHLKVTLEKNSFCLFFSSKDISIVLI